MITAVILHFYPERRPYLERIIERLNAGTVKPGRIVIWNNGPSISVERATVINSSENLGCGIRHLIALAFPSEYYLFHDDDLLVKEDTLQKMLEVATPDNVVGVEWYDRGIVLGRLHLCGQIPLVRATQFRVSRGLDLPFRTDDILLSIDNKTAIVSGGMALFENLPEGRTGLSRDRTHSDERKQYLQAVKRMMPR